MLGDEPPYLSVGTEVSAKYKGAFCEAKVRKVDRTVKCKVTFKLNLGTHTVSDSHVKGTLRVGATVEAKHPEKKEYFEGSIIKIQDCSQYTVVFDDGDITTLRRSALCLKSGRHFAESETLDQLPLTHPEHFGNPVVGGRRGRRRQGDDSSGDEETPKKGKQKEEKEADIGKVVCVELGDKKKIKDNWFPGLVVAPTAQDTVRIRVKEEYLVRSFKDGRYYTVPKKEATEFTREIGSKVDNNTLKTAVEKALYFLDKDELPPHWDRELLFGLIDSEDDTDTDAALDSDTSDDEPREEKDHFVAQLYKFMDDNATPINNCPSINSKDLDLYKLFKVVHKMNGYNRVDNHNQWKIVSVKLGLGTASNTIAQVKQAYRKYLHSFEDFYRKLGCTMVSHPRANQARNRSGRRLIRDKDRATPVNSVRLNSYPACSPKSDTKGESCCSETVTELPHTDVIIKEEKDKLVEEVEEKVKSKEEPLVTEIKSERPVRGRPTRRDLTTEDMYESEDSISKKSDDSDDFYPPKSCDSVTLRPASSLKKKFPTLKASPRVKEEGVKLREKRKLNMYSEKKTVKRPKLNTTINNTSGDEDNCRSASRLERRTTKTDVKSSPVINKSDDVSKQVNSKEVVKEQSATEKKIQHTRSRSKDSAQSKKDTSERRASKVQSKSSDTEVKKPTTNVKIKRGEGSDDNQKKGRKRRNTETGGRPPTVVAEEDLNLPCLPSFKSVLVGDIVKVYYGPPGETKVIYEAKVVDIESEESGQPVYLVHYAGWNSRYDEWVKRNKIADNLSWTPARGSRRAKTTPLKAMKLLSKRKPLPSKPGESGAAPRSTTPSSITSSSSRTKSPAMPSSTGSRRVTRNTEQTSRLSTRRTRRISGHTDLSIDSRSESDSDSSGLESDGEVQSKTPADKAEKKTDKEDNSGREDAGKKEVKKLGRIAVRRRRRRRIGQADSEDEDEDEDKSDATADDESEDVTDVDKRRGRRTRRSTPKKNEVDSVAGSSKGNDGDEDNDDDDDDDNVDDLKSRHQPKGRDFDLNIIRSELKGIEKAVKSTADGAAGAVKREGTDDKDKQTASAAAAGAAVTENKPDVAKVVSDIIEECIVQQNVVKDEPVTDTKETPVQPVPPLPAPKQEDKVEDSDDIYEFKEPEPFEFEVRTKLVSPEDRTKSNRRVISRIFDDILERSPDRSLSPKKPVTPVRTPATPPDKKEESRFRKTIGKKVKEIVTGEKKEAVVAVEKVESVLSMKKIVAETKESPVVNLIKLKSPEKELPVLRVEREVTQLQEPPVLAAPSLIHKPIQQPHHQLHVQKTAPPPPQLTTTIDDSKSFKITTVGEFIDKSIELQSQESLPDDSSEPPCLFPMTSSLFTCFNDKNDRPVSSPVLIKITEDQPVDRKIRDNVNVVSKKMEDEEDPISAAIQRVIAQTSVTDDDSDNMEIFSNKKLIFPKPVVPVVVQTSLPLIDTKLATSGSGLVFRSVSEMHLKAQEAVDDLIQQAAKPVKKQITPKKTVTVLPINDYPYPTSSSTLSGVRKVCSKRKATTNISNKRIVINKDDYSSDSDSSGEERLVIANDDESTSNQTSDDNLSLQCLAAVSTSTTAAPVAVASVAGAGGSEHGEEKKSSNPLMDVRLKRIEDRVKSPLPPTISIPEEMMLVGSSQEDDPKRGLEAEEEGESSLRSLLCEETIPGSPGPATEHTVRDTSDSVEVKVVTYSTSSSSASGSLQQPQQQQQQINHRLLDNLPPFHRPPVVARRDGNDAAVVMDNTPPTTPESNLSSISGSPREERVGSSSLDNESSKSHRDSSEVDLDNDDHRSRSNKYMKKSDKEHESPLKRKRASRKRSDSECNKRLRHSASRGVKLKDNMVGGGGGSDSDDTSESSQVGSRSLSSDPLLTSQSPRPSKYNFYGELDPELDASQRIAVLQQKLQDLKKTYMDVKSQLAVIDRRRKKLRRREREEKAAAAAAAMAAAAARSTTSITAIPIVTTTPTAAAGAPPAITTSISLTTNNSPSPAADTYP